ncbi:protelomerase family protein [Argonema antarcticum]|uniref:protelomerase family protein n=1 Tax=Argonema antarcticum TaxID=2942763 RepID=UPI00201242BD|nr:protelomerase family protein [Argonema antarcticum]MCL1476016.1 telomere resolvase [Argonema antarcticum A004/B2]
MVCSQAVTESELGSFKVSEEVLKRQQSIVSDFCQEISKKLGSRIQQFYQQILALGQSKYHSDGNWDISIHQDIAAKASQIKEWMNSQPGKRGSEALGFLTKLRYFTHIRNLLNSLVEATVKETYFTQVSSCIEIFQEQLKKQMAQELAQKKGRQKRLLAVRKKHKETINFGDLHQYALSVLSSLEATGSADWKQVSVALAIATGRRMAEIHQKATKFEYVEPHYVLFTGQLKARGDAAIYFQQNPSYLIPVLVDGSLVVKGHQWLKSNGLVATSPPLASRVFGGSLGQLMKHKRQDWGISHPYFTYKALRAIYAVACNQIFNSSDADNTLYIAIILGLGRGQLLKWGLITDTQTPHSYISDFRVTGTDCVCQSDPDLWENIYIQEVIEKEVSAVAVRTGNIYIQEEIDKQMRCDRTGAIYIQEELSRQQPSDRSGSIYIQEEIEKEVGGDRTGIIYIQEELSRQQPSDRSGAIYQQEHMGNQFSGHRTDNIYIQEVKSGGHLFTAGHE